MPWALLDAMPHTIRCEYEAHASHEVPALVLLLRKTANTLVSRICPEPIARENVPE